MELSKQEMEVFLLLSDLRSKNFYAEMFQTFTNQSITGFRNGKRKTKLEHIEVPSCKLVAFSYVPNKVPG